MARVTRKTEGFKRVRAAMKELDGVTGKVGYFDTSVYPDGTPVAYVAAIQELGYAAGGIPARPTMGPAIDANADKYRAAFEQGARRILKGETSATDVMELVVAAAAGDVRIAISELTSPPNAESTIRQKGHSKPLIGGSATVGKGHKGGMMLAAVNSAVEKKQ